MNLNDEMDATAKALLVESLDVARALLTGDVPLVINEPSVPQITQIGPEQDNISIVDRIQELPYSKDYIVGLQTRLRNEIETREGDENYSVIVLSALKGVASLVAALLM